MTIELKVGLQRTKNHLVAMDGLDGTTIIKATCIGCGIVDTFSVVTVDLKEWIDGALIQNAFPTMSVNRRELMQSGMCGRCFDRMFKDV